MTLLQQLKSYLNNRTKEQLEDDYKEILEDIKGVQGPLATKYINSLLDIKEKENFSPNFYKFIKVLECYTKTKCSYKWYENFILKGYLDKKGNGVIILYFNSKGYKIYVSKYKILMIKMYNNE